MPVIGQVKRERDFSKKIFSKFDGSKRNNTIFAPSKSPDGGIGRRAWLRAMFPFWECKFDSCSGHAENDECGRR
jgi:hypothetical protein